MLFLSLEFSFTTLLFYFIKLIYFNWKIITLYYFCHTSIWMATGIHVSPPSWMPLPCTSHPIPPGCHRGFGCSESYIKLPLAIYFTYVNEYVSRLFSQLIIPFPSLTESKSLFFISVSPLPGGLSSMGLHRVRHDWCNLAAAAAPLLPCL